MQEIIINSSNEGQKLKKICFRILKEAPQSFTYKMLRKKNITLNGKKATGEEVLKNGDSIKFFLLDETFSKFSPDYQMASNQPGSDNRQSANVMNQRDSENRGYFGDQVSSEDYSLSDSLDILYEDKDIAILNKGYGILSQKAGVDDISINELFVEYLIKNGKYDKNDQTYKPSVCNRLDRNTTGIILAGKSMKGLQFLSKHIKDKSIDKYYYTIVNGKMDKEYDIESFLKKNHQNNTVEIINATLYKKKGSPKDFDHIHTVFTPVKSNGEYTLIKVKLITGKTHQIRAQLAEMGYPVIGDYKYGSRKTNDIIKKKFGLNSQLLHAREIHFSKACENYSNKIFKAPFPERFISIAKELGLSI